MHVCTCLLCKKKRERSSKWLFSSAFQHISPHNEAIKTTIAKKKNVAEVDTYHIMSKGLTSLFASSELFVVEYTGVRYRTCDNKNLSVSVNIHFTNNTGTKDDTASGLVPSLCKWLHVLQRESLSADRYPDPVSTKTCRISSQIYAYMSGMWRLFQTGNCSCHKLCRWRIAISSVQLHQVVHSVPWYEPAAQTSINHFCVEYYRET